MSDFDELVRLMQRAGDSNPNLCLDCSRESPVFR